MEYKKIILPTHPHTDTLVGIFLLQEFGNEKYPGIDKAEIEVWNNLPEGENPESLSGKGCFLIDIGEGKFDHHFKGKTVSQLIAEDLEIIDNPCLRKLLTYAERDDKYGLGTISSDAIDKAFGLSGIITNLNKVFPQDGQKVANTIMPVIKAHYLEEKRRIEDLPKEFEKKIKEGKAEIFEVKQQKKKLKVVAIESDNPSILGWLRSSIGQKADVVIQKMPSGHVNILTRPLKRVDLRLTTILIRKEEIAANDRNVNLSPIDLASFGRVPGIPEWYYDKSTNSLQNGGINPKGTPSTTISFETIQLLIKDGLSQSFVFGGKSAPRRIFNQSSRIQENQYFLEVHLPLPIAEKIKEAIGLPVPGIKFHLPQNYHITLLYLGEQKEENLSVLFKKIETVLEKIKDFPIKIDSKELKIGKIAGYKDKSFYFPVSDKEGGKELKKIRSLLEESIGSFLSQEFFPHLTVATVLPGINDKVIEDAEINLDKKFKISFPVEKIRLTEIIKKPNGQIIYKTKRYFLLRQD